MARSMNPENAEAVALNNEGIGAAEIAKRQGRGEETVKSALKRARYTGKLLRKRRETQHSGGGYYARQPHREALNVKVEVVIKGDVATVREGGNTYRLPAIDTVACTRCGLRGHVAGDPDRCIVYRGSLGMGGAAAVAVDAAPAMDNEPRTPGGRKERAAGPGRKGWPKSTWGHLAAKCACASCQAGRAAAVERGAKESWARAEREGRARRPGSYQP